ncbi:hypothetical protein DBV15_03753 [Temnothorax longispinosus]|uniref:Uncharacterized protein n=1 Tax=Temnothorax longispinosus TaxID=300112 RepID=A0A4V6RGL1_9HYME|nr:hypothetical protein DBV15_03753 [Temnothorax longispinosus]
MHTRARSHVSVHATHLYQQYQHRQRKRVKKTKREREREGVRKREKEKERRALPRIAASYSRDNCGLRVPRTCPIRPFGGTPGSEEYYVALRREREGCSATTREEKRGERCNAYGAIRRSARRVSMRRLQLRHARRLPQTLSRERERERERKRERERREKSETSHRHRACCLPLFVGRQRTRNNFSEGTPRPVHVGIELPPAFRYPVSRAWSAIRELPARLVPPPTPPPPPPPHPPLVRRANESRQILIRLDARNAGGGGVPVPRHLNRQETTDVGIPSPLYASLTSEMRFSTSAQDRLGTDNGDRSGSKRKREEERDQKERACEGRGEETQKGRKRRRAGDRWSDFTLGLFSDGRRYETPSRACSNSGIPILRFAEIVTFHPARGFSRKSDEDGVRGRKAVPNPTIG